MKTFLRRIHLIFLSGTIFIYAMVLINMIVFKQPQSIMLLTSLTITLIILYRFYPTWQKVYADDDEEKVVE